MSNVFSFKKDIDVGNNYKGLRIHALPGLHQYVESLIGEYVKPGSSVLDLAAGSGAMSLRLKDNGFRVTSSDIVGEKFRLHDCIDFFTCDLNKEFSKKIDKKFDCIVATELIEHLENPFNFIRESTKILKDNGFIFVTTPNINNPVSKALNLRFDYFQWFSEDDYKREGHISPISLSQIRRFSSEFDLEIICLTSFGDPFRIVNKWPRMKLLSKMINLITKLPRDLAGEILVVIYSKVTGKNPLSPSLDTTNLGKNKNSKI